jgi:hypothetical protein
MPSVLASSWNLSPSVIEMLRRSLQSKKEAVAKCRAGPPFSMFVSWYQRMYCQTNWKTSIENTLNKSRQETCADIQQYWPIIKSTLCKAINGVSHTAP